MKIRLVSVLALLALAAAATAQAPAALLDKNDRKKVGEMLATYFAAREKDDPKALAKAYDALDKKMKEVAKAKKVETVLSSAPDVRAVFPSPPEPEPTVKKGAWVEFGSKERVGAQDFEYKYLLRAPKSYDAAVPSTLIVALHPPLTKPEDLKKWAAAAYPDSLADQAIVLVPYYFEDGSNWSSPVGRQRAFFSLNRVLARFHVDQLKVFLDGDGASAAPASEYVTSMPSCFAAVILRRPEGLAAGDQLANARNLKHLLLAVGEGDGAKACSTFADDAKAKGVEATVVPSGIAETGAPTDAGLAAIGALLAETSKAVAPKRLHFTTKSDLFLGSYWLVLTNAEFAPGQAITVEAEVNTASNEIHVKTPPSVKAFKIYLNHDLVDMGKPIKVVHTVQTGEQADTQVRFNGTRRANLEKALKYWFENASGNYGEVYTNEIEVTVP